jgi:hypothetical protein
MSLDPRLSIDPSPPTPIKRQRFSGHQIVHIIHFHPPDKSTIMTSSSASLITLLVALIASLQAVSAGVAQRGMLTNRSFAQPNQCGFKSLFSDNTIVAGVDDKQFGTTSDGVKTSICGQCVQLTATSGSKAGESVTVVIVDRIFQNTGDNGAQFDIASAAFAQIATPGGDNPSVNAKSIPCPGNIQSQLQ